MIPVVAGSNPVGHPKPTKWRAPALRQDALAPALEALIRAALVQVERNAPHACGSSDTEYLHQLRVGLRRLRAALRAFRRLLPENELLLVRKCYRRVRAPLGRARDWDVFMAWLEAAGAPDDLVRRARLMREAGSEEARRAIASPVFTRLIALSRALVPRNGKMAGVARRALMDARRATLRQAQRMDWSREADLHKLRIRVRRERYICEALARNLRAYIGCLKTLQDTLGELNDVAVARRLLRRLGCQDFDSLLRARREALLSALRANWAAYLAARTPPRRATAKAGADGRARVPRGRFPPRTPAARPAAGGAAPGR